MTKSIKVKILIFCFVLLGYLALRFQNLTSIPVFGDEAIYLRWSQLIKNVETLRFVPVSDGKQPLYMWITAVSYKLISDPLVAGRTISIFSGVGVMLGVYLISVIFFNQSIATLSILIYLFLPFVFFFDRLASADTMLSFFGILTLFLSLYQAKKPRLDNALILGFVMGLAWLTKSPAIYFIILSWVTFFQYGFENIKKLYFPILSTLIAFLMYNILRLGPQFQQIGIRNLDYVWPLSEIIKHPLDPFIPHLKDIVNIYIQYISIPLMTISLIGWVFAKNQFKKYSFTLLYWWLLPLIANAIFAKTFTARYILFTVPPLIILISIGVVNFYLYSYKYFNNKFLLILIILLCFIPNSYWIYHTSTDPFKVELPSTESGYISGWTSGWGIKSSSQYLIERSKYANVIVGTEGFFGTLPDGLQIYTDSLPRLTIFGVGIDLTEIPPKLIDARQHGDEVYMLFNQSRLKLTQVAKEKTTLISSYPKPDGDNLLLLKLN